MWWGPSESEAYSRMPGEEEFDLTADYRPKKSLLGTLWFPVRGAFSRQMGSKESTRQVQVTFNHEIPLI